MALKYVYDDKSEENVSVVQKTGFWKTSFVQRLAVSNIFGGLEKKKKMGIIESAFWMQKNTSSVLF